MKFTPLPMKVELTEGSETSAYINQTPGNYTKGNLLYSVHGESLKSRKFFALFFYDAASFSFLPFLLSRIRKRVVVKNICGHDASTQQPEVRRQSAARQFQCIAHCRDPLEVQVLLYRSCVMWGT